MKIRASCGKTVRNDRQPMCCPCTKERKVLWTRKGHFPFLTLSNRSLQSGFLGSLHHSTVLSWTRFNLSLAIPKSSHHEKLCFILTKTTGQPSQGCWSYSWRRATAPSERLHQPGEKARLAANLLPSLL